MVDGGGGGRRSRWWCRRDRLVDKDEVDRLEEVGSLVDGGDGGGGGLWEVVAVICGGRRRVDVGERGRKETMRIWIFFGNFDRISVEFCYSVIFFLVGGSGEDDDVGVGLMGFDGGY